MVCPHNKKPSECPQEGCAGHCPHTPGRLKKNCPEQTCSGCDHGNVQAQCATCHPCPHGKLKCKCKQCKSCPHDKLKNSCKKCNPCACTTGLPEDDRKLKADCKNCSPCLTHGNRGLRRRCALCVAAAALAPRVSTHVVTVDQAREGHYSRLLQHRREATCYEKT